MIRQLGPRRPFPKGPVVLAWDGTDNAGAVASDGRYRLRVTLSSGRQLTIRRRIRLDTTPPQIAIGQVRHGRKALAIPYTRSRHDSRAELIAFRGRRPVYHKRNRSPNPPSLAETIP